MNRVILVGNIISELKWVEGSYIKFTVAVKRKFSKEKESDYISCVAFGNTADTIGKYFYKGAMIAVEGELRTGSYEKDGKKVYTTEVTVSTFDFCEKPPKKADKEELPFD